MLFAKRLEVDMRAFLVSPLQEGTYTIGKTFELVLSVLTTVHILQEGANVICKNT